MRDAVVTRFAHVPVADPGTPERQWQRWGLSFPALDLSACERMVVVAPHPDDEVLGVGGLMALAVAAGTRVDVVAVTDGEGSHSSSRTVTAAELRRVRPIETERALAELGLTAPPVRLGIADGEVTRSESQVSDALTEMLANRHGSTWCVGPWEGDGHPDHDATGRACRAAAAATGATLVSYPVWMWHWAQPDDPDVPWQRARSIPLPEPVLAAKKAAVQHFSSQITSPPSEPDLSPVVPPHVLDRLLRGSETVFV